MLTLIIIVLIYKWIIARTASAISYYIILGEGPGAIPSFRHKRKQLTKSGHTEINSIYFEHFPLSLHFPKKYLH